MSVIHGLHAAMVYMQPWFACTVYYTVCSLLYWVRFVNKRGKIKKSSKLYAELQIAWDYMPIVNLARKRIIVMIENWFWFLIWFFILVTRWLRRRKSDRRERRRRERREEREAEEAQRQQATQIPMVYQVLKILYDLVIYFVLLLINCQGNDAPWPWGGSWRQACDGS